MRVGAVVRRTDVGSQPVDDCLCRIVPSQFQCPVHAHQDGLRGRISLRAVRLAILPKNHRRPNLSLGEVVLPRHIGIVQEAEDVLGMTPQTLGQSSGIRSSSC